MNLNIEIDDWNKLRLNYMRIPLIIIYDHPSDYPEGYIARVWDSDKPTDIVMKSHTIEEIRKTLPKSMINIGRSPDDDPVILESWIVA